MSTKAQRAREAARAAAQAAAEEQGEEWFKLHTEAPLAAVEREANKRFTTNAEHDEVWAFVQAFSRARARRDEFLKGD